jgi:hypothetical protein
MEKVAMLITTTRFDNGLGESLRRAELRRRAAATGQVATQLAMILTAAVAYLGVRAITGSDVDAAHRNADGILRFEGALGLRWESSVQQLVLDHPTVMRAFNAVYVWGFWPLVITALVVLYRADRTRYLVLRNAVFLSGLVGLAVFAAFPVAPPRFLDGFTDTVAELSGQGGVAHPSKFANEYAAMPSFHVGWTLLAVVALLPVLRSNWWRAAALGYAALMTVTVVVTANHYVVDAVAGIAVSLAAFAVARRVAAPRPIHAAVAVSPAAIPADRAFWVEEVAA